MADRSPAEKAGRSPENPGLRRRRRLLDRVQQDQRHRAHDDPFWWPGLSDITSHVDFTAVAEAAAAAGARVHGPVDQGAWLTRLGIDVRLAKLSAGKDPERRRALESGVQRLTDPRGMGSLFKAMALTHPSLTPEGFA